ncbi:hypothetical protein [Nocardia blacklockiae]|uniref:hypothetical protein n=1 Tax=Nocardia blacklockiae TaxID=480036 RepID=UPI0018949C55|nr:hypothetical protein [Nocardia blacklockiae]MBF6170080.1 hypothetical protein [Nocardia blacklockiae]
MQDPHPVARLLEDGSIAVRYTVPDAGGGDRRGDIVYAPDDPDYPFWAAQLAAARDPEP